MIGHLARKRESLPHGVGIPVQMLQLLCSFAAAEEIGGDVHVHTVGRLREVSSAIFRVDFYIQL